MKYTLYLQLTLFLVFGSIFHARSQIISTYAGTGIAGFSGDGGQATSATLYWPCGVLITQSGNLLFTDEENFCVRRITPSGIISTIAGLGGITTAGYHGDGGQATAAKLSSDWGITLDATGNLLITDENNHTIRKVNSAGIISSITSDTSNVSDGDGGPVSAAHFKFPVGITSDISGNIYVGDADAYNIRKIDASGIVHRYAGTTGLHGYSGDGGPATDARITYPNGLAADKAGNLYFCDGGANCVRKITPAGIISTIAGTGTAGFSGDGGPATGCELNNPTGVYVERSGNILITDCSNHRIRRIDQSGIIKTIAGTGTGSFGGDGGLCTHAELNYPANVVTDSLNNIYITDNHNNRIRKITMVLFFASHSVHVHYCQNTPLILLDSLLKASDQAIGLIDKWSIVPGFTAHHGSAFVADSAPASGTGIIPSGSYYSPNFGFVGTDTIKVIVTNGIATDTETVYITMDAFVNNAGRILGDSMVCVGTSILLSDTAAGGNWTVSNLYAVVINGVVTGKKAGIDTIIYTVANTCGYASVTKQVTINALPNTGSITGVANVCVGTTVVLTDTVTGGVWSLSNGNATMNPLLTNCYVNGYLPGKDTIYYTVTDSFCTASTNLALTIIAQPVSKINGGSPIICTGSRDTLTGIPSGGIWALSNTNASMDSIASRVILTAITTGPDTLTYTITNYCGSAVAAHPFEIDTLPVRPTIARVEGALYAPHGYAGYQWYLDGVPVSGAVADTFVVAREGAYSVEVSNSFGCSVFSDSLEFPGCGPQGILVYPNPTASKVYVTWCQEVTLRLICMDGRVALTLHHTNEIDLSGLANEDYLLAIYDVTGKKVAVKLITKLE